MYKNIINYIKWFWNFRDSGVSPERIVVPGKHVSFDRKFSSEDEKAVSDENLTCNIPQQLSHKLQVKTGETETNLPRGSSPTYQEPLGGVAKDTIEGSPVSLNYEVPQISPGDKDKGTSDYRIDLSFYLEIYYVMDHIFLNSVCCEPL